MRQDVLIILVRVAQRQRVEMLAQQFDRLVTDARGVALVRELRGQIGRQPQPMIGLTQQQRPGVGRDSRIRQSQLDRAVERRLKQPPASLAGLSTGLHP